MTFSKQLPSSEKEVRCFKINTSGKYKKRFGLVCNHVIAIRNSQNEVSGLVKCKNCKTRYEIINDSLNMLMED